MDRGAKSAESKHMTPQPIESKSFISEPLARYVDTVSLREAPILAKLREETNEHPERVMPVSYTHLDVYKRQVSM